MFKKALLLAALAAGSLGAPAQAAEFMFNFTTSTPLFGNTVSGMGTFTTSDVATSVAGQTAFAITKITGTVNGLAITAPGGNYGNYFTTGPSFLDGTGISFTVTGGGRVDFFNQSTNGLYRVNTFSPGSSNFVTAMSSAIAPVPEPMSWALFIAGLAMIGGMLRTRTRTRVAFAA